MMERVWRRRGTARRRRRYESSVWSVSFPPPLSLSSADSLLSEQVNGKWETEIVRDPSVIKAYVHQRSVIDEEKLEADELLPSDDEGKNERRKKRYVLLFYRRWDTPLTAILYRAYSLKEQLEKLKRNQERRLARKNQKLGIAPGQIGVGGKKMVKTETTRVCGNCGQRGHMKTSRKLCPRWAEFNQVRRRFLFLLSPSVLRNNVSFSTLQPKTTEPSASLPTNFGGGLALPPMGGPANSKIKLKMGAGTSGTATPAAGAAGSPPPPSTAAPTPAGSPPAPAPPAAEAGGLPPAA